MTDIINKITKRLSILPPDPDEMNAIRAKRVDDAFRSYNGTIDEDTVADFLCDFKHWMDRHPEFDVDKEANRASDNYARETWSQNDEN